VETHLTGAISLLELQLRVWWNHVSSINHPCNNLLW